MQLRHRIPRANELGNTLAGPSMSLLTGALAFPARPYWRTDSLNGLTGWRAGCSPPPTAPELRGLGREPGGMAHLQGVEADRRLCGSPRAPGPRGRHPFGYPLILDGNYGNRQRRLAYPILSTLRSEASSGICEEVGGESGAKSASCGFESHGVYPNVTVSGGGSPFGASDAHAHRGLPSPILAAGRVARPHMHGPSSRANQTCRSGPEDGRASTTVRSRAGVRDHHSAPAGPDAHAITIAGRTTAHAGAVGARAGCDGLAIRTCSTDQPSGMCGVKYEPRRGVAARAMIGQWGTRLHVCPCPACIPLRRADPLATSSQQARPSVRRPCDCPPPAPPSAGPARQVRTPRAGFALSGNLSALHDNFLPTSGCRHPDGRGF